MILYKVINITFDGILLTLTFKLVAMAESKTVRLQDRVACVHCPRQKLYTSKGLEDHYSKVHTDLSCVWCVHVVIGSPGS